jgi:hypothetical protein
MGEMVGKAVLEEMDQQEVVRMQEQQELWEVLQVLEVKLVLEDL